jgi:hypothetical protein
MHFEGGGYEAQVFIGWDEKRSRYVAHWIDVFGGPYSEHAFFRDTFSFNGNAWHLLIESRDKAGNWTIFADDWFTSQGS